MSPSPPPTTFIALLRAVNLAGHKAIAMSDLRALLTGIGYADPRSLLQSGNLVFCGAGDTATTAAIERQLETEAAARLALKTEFFVRTAAEWKRLVAQNPLPAEAERDPSHLVLLSFKEAPVARDVEALQAAIAGPEIVRVKGRQGYVVYPNGIGRSRLTLALMERKLGTRGTGRNWNTVRKLAELAGA